MHLWNQLTNQWDLVHTTACPSFYQYTALQPNWHDVDWNNPADFDKYIQVTAVGEYFVTWRVEMVSSAGFLFDSAEGDLVIWIDDFPSP